MNLSRYLSCYLFLAAVILSIPPDALGQSMPFNDPSLSVDQRVNDLVGRMTLEEKIAQMQNAATGIPRLGVPEYEWWNEALHGVARAGIATVFPQAIGLAATFNDKMVLQVADATSTEARAKHHEFVRRGERGRYKGLTFWTPNINIFRDPRWGRGQETWGEDPYLTGKLGTAFVKGLQGSDPKYLKTVSTVKHYAVHSGPEPERHAFDAIASQHDMWDTYLPAFRTTIVDGGATGVMCAYNRLNGEAACASKELYDILFNRWKFKGHVVSDCGAIDNIYLRHKIVKTEAEASAISVKGGTDLTCGREYKSLGEAVKTGLITETEIDVSVKRLMAMRFRLGLFDPDSMVKYAQTPFSENDSPKHHEISLQAARESLVLLKNDGVLPLKKDLKTIAVIGPNADDEEVLLGNYNGEPSVSVTPLGGIVKKVSPATKVLHSIGMYPTGTLWESVSPEALSNGGAKGLKAEYFNNRELSGQPALVRTDANIDFQWNSLSPAPGVNDDNFSVRWTGKIKAPESGKFTFGIRGNGPVRVWLDNKLLIEETANRRTRNETKEVDFEAGRSYDIKIEYVENANHYAQAKLFWAPPSAQASLRADAIAKAKQADAVVMVMGISPRIEGEEMPVTLEGFRGGDRTDISLPKPQTELIKAVKETGKPVVLVLMGGSALAVNWENDNVPAIIHAWYPGQFGGAAIADVLFGDYNPAGRLPVTFYKSVDQLPPFDDYKMEGRTYRYFKGEPLYPFGYGLSYSQFAYSGLKMNKAVAAGKNLDVTVDVRNAGKMAGDEVVQLYITDPSANSLVPVRSLVGVERVNLKSGEKRSLKFTLTPRQMSIVNNEGKRILEPGQLNVTIGGGQPGPRTATVAGSFTVTGKTIEIPQR